MWRFSAGLQTALIAVLVSPFVRAAEAGNGRTEPFAGLAASIILLLFLALLAVVVVGGTLFDLAARREEEAGWLEERIVDAVNEALGTVPIVVLVELPDTRRAPVVVELSGTLPSWELRKAVLSVVTEGISRIRRDVRIEDRLEVRDAADRYRQLTARPA